MPEIFPTPTKPTRSGRMAGRILQRRPAYAFILNLVTMDLNADVGEGFPWDEDLMAIVTSGNVCLGGHAGYAELTRFTAIRWREYGRAIGMHPGYPDRDQMGRRSPLPEARLSWESEAIDQTNAFLTVGMREGRSWRYLKPHGALYHDSAKDWTEAGQAVQFMLRESRLPLLGLPGSDHERIAELAKVSFYREGFADRRYRDDGTLVPRTEPNATIESDDEAAEHAVRLALSGRFDSLCLHGDKPGCVERALAVRAALEREGFTIAPFAP
ncbi:LamB/YcsF family protein [bacterium]|nr:MAG: LamB/YcsF family protein [bacterium]